MDILKSVTGVFQKAPKVEKEHYLALVIEDTYVSASVWTLGEDNKPLVIASGIERGADPSWQDRIRMADIVIGRVEEQAGLVNLKKVVLGLGDRFLTQSEDIKPEIRKELKKLTTELALTPLGFVPILTGIAHHLKQKEGVPTSAILIGVSEAYFDIAMYRVGRLAFHTSIQRTEAIGEDIEGALKSAPDNEVLPSRILLFGADDVRVEEVKAQLLRHQWTTKANFLHYPKIDRFPTDTIAEAIAQSGASELTHSYKDEEGIIENEESTEEAAEKSPEEEKPVPPEEPEDTKQHIAKQKEGADSVHMVVVQPETLGFSETHAKPKEMSYEDLVSHKETVGMKKEKEEQDEEEIVGGGTEEEREGEKEQHEKKNIAAVFFGFFQKLTDGLHLKGEKKLPVKLIGLIAAVLAVFIGGYYAVVNIFPTVAILLFVLPEKIEYSDTITIDPTATAVDSEKKIVPGKKVEKTVSGEKTVPATGKKKIGDPAKGTVTVFNKSAGESQVLKKGTVFTTNSLQYTLDSDVTIASATTNVSGDALVFGKGSGALTANFVGTDGNITANNEFSVKGYDKNVLVARNDQAFSGGNSKDVIVVSRTDTENLQKVLTADLIEKAKAELAQSVTGGEEMVDSTVKTSVKEKKFIEEIDQEAKELHGSLTVAVTATTFNEEDVKSFLSGFAKDSVRSGYVINEGRTTVSIGEVKVAKDGKMTTKATLTSFAVPSIDSEAVKKDIMGKTLTDAEAVLRNIPGVSRADFIFGKAWKKDRIPSKTGNITITVEVSE